MRAHLLVAMAVVSASPVRAAPAADIVVSWAPGPLGPLGDALADVAGRAGASYVDLSPEAIALPDPRPLIKRGIVAYNSLELDAALKALDAAAELVDQTGAAGVDTTTLGDLFLYRALTHSTRGEDVRSWDDLVIAASIDPARVLDPAGFPPRAVDRFGQARAHVAALPRGTVTLTGGVGCRVRIDGSIVTTTAVELPFGRHWLDAACDGYLPVRRRFVIDRVAFEIPVAGPAIVPPDDTALMIQARTAAARAMVVVIVQPRTAVIRRIGIDGKERDRASIRLRGTARDRGDVVIAVNRLIAPPPIAPPQRWYRSPWLWAAAGAAVAGAVLIPFAARDSGTAPSVLVRPEGVPPWP